MPIEKMDYTPAANLLVVAALPPKSPIAGIFINHKLIVALIGCIFNDVSNWIAYH